MIFVNIFFLLVEDRYQFKTDCVNRYNQALANITKHEKEGYLVVGFDLPRCDLDGSYQPVQCQNDKCFCVSRDGKPYRGAKNERLEVDRYDPLAADQQCSKFIYLFVVLLKNKLIVFM